jgi:sRNA-binding protein
MKNQTLKLGQKINYTVCNSVYNGTIVKIKKDTLIVIDCESGMTLWNAGYNVGSEITINQVK